MAKRIGEKIFTHLQVIQYYRYLREYDESFKSIFQYPKPIDPTGEAEPELDIAFLKDWDKDRDHTKNWQLGRFDHTRISKSKFAELFSRYCVRDEDLMFGSGLSPPGLFTRIPVYVI